MHVQVSGSFPGQRQVSQQDKVMILCPISKLAVYDEHRDTRNKNIWSLKPGIIRYDKLIDFKSF